MIDLPLLSVPCSLPQPLCQSSFPPLQHSEEWNTNECFRLDKSILFYSLSLPLLLSLRDFIPLLSPSYARTHTYKYCFGLARMLFPSSISTKQNKWTSSIRSFPQLPYALWVLLHHQPSYWHLSWIQFPLGYSGWLLIVQHIPSHPQISKTKTTFNRD